MELFGFAARLLIGGLFIGSAVPKLLAPLQFQQIVMRYGTVPAAWARPLSRALPWVELGLAAMLLSGFLAVARVLGRGMHKDNPGHTFILVDKQGVTRLRTDYFEMYIPDDEILDSVQSVVAASRD